MRCLARMPSGGGGPFLRRVSPSPRFDSSLASLDAQPRTAPRSRRMLQCGELKGVTTRQERHMAAESMYLPDRIGDWGVPRAVTGGTYGEDVLPMADGVKVFCRAWRSPRRRCPRGRLPRTDSARTPAGSSTSATRSTPAASASTWTTTAALVGPTGPRGHVRDANSVPARRARFPRRSTQAAAWRANRPRRAQHGRHLRHLRRHLERGDRRPAPAGLDPDQPLD